MHAFDSAELHSDAVALFPKLNAFEQRLSIALYRSLAEGAPVSRERLTTVLDVSRASIAEIMSRWRHVVCDDSERIVAYRGLSILPTRHRMTVRAKTLYTWCAWDTLFIPGILGVPAQIESNCPQTNRPIRLEVAADRATPLDPIAPVMSWPSVDAAAVDEDLIANFCQQVHFFYSEEVAMARVSQHVGMQLLHLEDAFALAKHQNLSRYADVFLPAS